MIDLMNLNGLRTDMFGGDAGLVDRPALEREIKRKLEELNALNRRLLEAGNMDVSREASTKVAATLGSECPYMELNVKRTGEGRAELPASEREFFLSVEYSPLHAISKSSGKPLMSSVPLNMFSLRFVSRRLVQLTVGSACWDRAAAMDLLDSNGRPLPEVEPMVETGCDFGHPHCARPVPPGRKSETFDSSALCLGNNEVASLASKLNSDSTLLLFMKAAYAWLTEVAAGDCYSVNLAPVKFSESYMSGTVVPACRAARGVVMEFVNSPGYAQFVEAARNGTYRRMGAMPREALNVLREVPQMAGTRMLSQLSKCASRTGDQVTYFEDAAMGLAAHQILAGVICLGDGVAWQRQVLQKIAEQPLLVGFDAWHLSTVAGPQHTVLKDREFAKYVADWEVMKDGNYNV